MSSKTSQEAVDRRISGNSSSLLDRLDFSQAHSSLTETQALVDQTVSHSIDEIAKPETMIALLGAGGVSRLTRIGVLSAVPEGKVLLPLLAQGGSYALALANESFAFAGIERGFSHLEGRSSTESFGKAWARSALSLGSLKFFGKITEGQNIVLQHLSSDLGMVGAQNLAHAFRITDAPQGTLAEQMLQAEATNWNMKGSQALLHGLSPHLFAAERSLDLYLENQETDLFSQTASFFSRLMMATEGGAQGETLKGPTILKMASKKRKDDSGEESSERERLLDKLDQRDREDWSAWDRWWKSDPSNASPLKAARRLIEGFRGYPRDDALRLKVLKKIAPRFQPADRLSFAYHIEELMGDDPLLSFFLRRVLVDVLVPLMDPKDQLALALKVEKRLGHENGNVRQAALEVLEVILPSLGPENLFRHISKIVTHLKQETDALSQMVALDIFKTAVPRLKAKILFDLAVPLLEMKSFLSGRSQFLSIFHRIFLQLSPSDRFLLSLHIEGKLNEKNIHVHEIIRHLLRISLKYLSPKDALKLKKKVRTRLDEEAAKIDLDGLLATRRNVNYSEIIGENKFIYFGELHSHDAVAEEMTRIMPFLRKNGFQYLATEFFNKFDQDLLDDFYEGKISRRQFTRRILERDRDMGLRRTGFAKDILILEAATQNDIRVIGMEGDHAMLSCDDEISKKIKMEKDETISEDPAPLIENIADGTEGIGILSRIHLRNRYAAEVLEPFISEKIAFYGGAGHYGNFPDFRHRTTLNSILRDRFGLEGPVVYFAQAGKKDPIWPIQNLQINLPKAAQKKGLSRKKFVSKIPTPLPWPSPDYIVHLP